MTMIAALWGARGLALVGALLIGLLGVKAWQLRQQSLGAAKVVATINKQAEKISAKADQARERASVPDAAERLRRRSCRDC